MVIAGGVVLEKERMNARENPAGGIHRTWQPLGSSIWWK